MSGVEYMARLGGADFGLAEVIAVGDRVRHHGTKQWATVLEVHPQRDGTAELVLERDPPRYVGDDQGKAHWATYHCDRHERPEKTG